MNKAFSILIPTWNNPQYLDPCMRSIRDTRVLDSGFAEVIIINNGSQPCAAQYADWPNVKVVGTGENLGWEGGLKLGLEHSTTPYVVFQNDDTFIPPTSHRIYDDMLILFRDPKVGAVGPGTTVAAGVQSIFHPAHPSVSANVRWLIGFTVMLRRSALDAAGGVDATMPGGDDFDISIRLRKAGYRLMVNPKSFLIHHGFKTGVRVHGDQNVDGGWNSPRMQERTNRALIQKHGFKEFFITMSRQYDDIQAEELSLAESDVEGRLIREMVGTGETVLELGCGGKKTVENSVGVDIMMPGSPVAVRQNLDEKVVADVVADVTKPMPVGRFDVIIARHILEHITNTPAAIRNWLNHLETGGRLIIAVPDEEIINSIPLDPTHVHAFTRDSLRDTLDSLGLHCDRVITTGNGISMIGVFRRKADLYTLDRAYEGDCSTIPLEAYVIKGEN